jgi:DNA-binding NarL/FixJ family response regulator
MTTVPAPAATAPGGTTGTLTVSVARDDGDWPYRKLLLRDGGLRLRFARSPYEALRDGACHVVLLRGPDAAHDVVRLLGTPEKGTAPVLLLCPAEDRPQIAAGVRLGVTSCLVEGDYDGRTLLNAIWSTAAGHTHLSPAAVAALVRTPGSGPGDVPGGGGGTLYRMLSPRERQIMDLVATGAKVAEIGQRMSIKAKTVRNHLSAIYTKLGVSGCTEAVLLWLNAGPRPDRRRADETPSDRASERPRSTGGRR